MKSPVPDREGMEEEGEAEEEEEEEEGGGRWTGKD